MNDEWAGAAKYLENLQRHVYESIGLRDRLAVKNKEEETNENLVRQLYSRYKFKVPFEEFYKTWLAEVKERRSQRPTPFESEYYDVLHHIGSGIEEALKGFGDVLPRPVILGTLPTGRVNGMAMALPANPYILVVFEDGLFGFANLLAKAISRCFVFQGDEDGRLAFSTKFEDCREELNANPEIMRRFAEVMFAYLVAGNPLAAPSYLPEERYIHLSDMLRTSMETFVLAHEYGHVVCGHLNSEKTKGQMLGTAEVEEFKTNWNQEFEADVKGLELMLAVRGKQGFDLSLNFWGADLFFACIDMLERAVGILSCGDPKVGLSATHPPTPLRRESLRQVLRNSLSAEDVKAPLQLSDTLAQVSDTIWSRLEPILYRMHKDGVQLAPIWRV